MIDDDPVWARIAELFPAAEIPIVHALLDRYGADSSPRGRAQVQLAILQLCGGEVDEVRRLVDEARRDWRDVLAWSEEARGVVDPLEATLKDAIQSPHLTPRRLELLCEAVPSMRRAAVLWQPQRPGHREQVATLEARAAELGLALLPAAVTRPEGFAEAFAMLRRERAEGLVVLSCAFFELQRRQVAALAIAAGLAAVGEMRQFAVAGGLLSYGPPSSKLGARARDYVLGALGASPAPSGQSLPIKLDCVINLRTARLLSLTMPAAVLAQATRVLR